MVPEDYAAPSDLDNYLSDLEERDPNEFRRVIKSVDFYEDAGVYE